jgi:hypothetical protein
LDVETTVLMLVVDVGSPSWRCEAAGTGAIKPGEFDHC